MDISQSLLAMMAASTAMSLAACYTTGSSTLLSLTFKFISLLLTTWMVQFWSWAFYHVILRPKFLSKLRSLPEPTENRSWWNGYANREYVGMKGAVVREWQKTLKHSGLFRYLGLFNQERIIVTSREGVSELMKRYQYDFPKTEMLRLLAEPIIGNGLVIVNGDEHKRQRRLLTPVFTPKYMRALQPVFWEKSVEVMEKFTEITNKTAAASGFSEPINVDTWTGLAGLDIISKAALGVDYESIRKPDSELVANYREVFEPTLLFRYLAGARLLIPIEWLKKLPLERVQHALKAIKLLNESFHKEIARKKDLMGQGELMANDIISCLIRDRHCLDDDELVTHMLTMLGAGHETVAVSITWAMYEFCRSPQWQRLVRAEVRARLPLPGSGAVPNFADLEGDNMPVLNAFVSEVLRYWPAIPLSSRTAAKDTTLLGVAVPAKTKISISIVAFNRDSANWGPTADKFDPSRWLMEEEGGNWRYDSNGGALHQNALATFLHGQRACIGRVFARHQMLNVLSCWIGRFEFILSDSKQMDENEVEVSGGGITSRPVHGIWVHARRISGW